MSKELAIVQSESVQMIITGTPQTYNENVMSHDRCVDFGQRLLQTIQAQGMTDELDQQAATFIEKARKTVAKMNEKRSPITKLFDNIRKEFTVLENDIDPTKAGTVASQLQLMRNKFAAAKREEEERRRREELARQQQQQARDNYRLALEDDYRRQFNALLDKKVADLLQLNSTVTLDNIDQLTDQVRNIECELPATFLLMPSITPPYVIATDEREAIKREVWNAVLPKLREQYHVEIESNRDALLDMLPSKKVELERAAKANAEEAERIKREIAQREAEEAARKEAERKQREQRERQEAEMRQRNAEMNSLFNGAQAEVAAYQPKTSVKKRLVPLNTEAFSEIFMFWWVNEGQNLPVDELSKVCKKMITFAERAANDKANPMLIQSEHIEYVEDVKAK